MQILPPTRPQLAPLSAHCHAVAAPAPPTSRRCHRMLPTCAPAAAAALHSAVLLQQVYTLPTECTMLLSTQLRSMPLVAHHMLLSTGQRFKRLRRCRSVKCCLFGTQCCRSRGPSRARFWPDCEVSRHPRQHPAAAPPVAAAPAAAPTLSSASFAQPAGPLLAAAAGASWRAAPTALRMHVCVRLGRVSQLEGQTGADGRQRWCRHAGLQRINALQAVQLYVLSTEFMSPPGF